MSKPNEHKQFSHENTGELQSLDPTQFDYWVVQGHSAFQKNNYEQAINAYSMASMINPKDIRPHVWAANTFEKGKDFAHAKMALTSAIALAQEAKDSSVIQFLENKLQNIQAH